MSDLIRREDAIKAVNRAKAEGMTECPTYYLGIIPSADRPNPHAVTYINALENRIKKLEKDRPKGEWIDRGMRVPSSWIKKCSLCGYETDTWRWCNYCPNCGADMRGEDDDN